MTPEVCPNCEAEVPPGATSCPSCGADENTGWSQGAYCDRLGIQDPDEPFDYGGFLKEEFGSDKGHAGRGKPAWIWIATAAVLVGMLLLLAF